MGLGGRLVDGATDVALSSTVASEPSRALNWANGPRLPSSSVSAVRNASSDSAELNV